MFKVMIRSIVPPGVRAVIRSAQRKVDPDRSRKHIFSSIFNSNVWNSDVSVSGAGAELAQTEVIRREIPGLLKQIGAQSLLDAPCGDFNWMKDLDLGDIGYIGVDLVPGLIKRNSLIHGAAGREFLCRDVVIDPLPRADVILSRDCLVHLAFAEAKRAIENFKRSGAHFLLTTTFDRPENRDITTGDWRPLDLRKPPFNFPEPLHLLVEGCTENGGIYADKALGLWKLQDI